MNGSDDRHGTDGTAPMDGTDRTGGMDGIGGSDRTDGTDRTDRTDGTDGTDHTDRTGGTGGMGGTGGTGGMDDGAIAGAVRGIVAMEASREVLAARVTALRTATSAEELAERDRCGAAMAEADARILLESIEVLDRLGMTSAAMACSYVAREEGLLPAP
ncbi:hypothetical protein [Streptomyces lavendulocolor]|uniref:hypothetical protein n=1 Tax=Streptomyces lavendulocolor TaxID=67316 RepID=UPI003C306CB2